MMSEPDGWHAFMDVLARLVGRYLRAQVEAGAQVLQLFDSWAGLLSPADYREFVLPYSRAVIAAAGGSGVPLIHFAAGSAGLLELLQEAGGDVIGVDWRVDLDSAWRRLGEGAGAAGQPRPGGAARRALRPRSAGGRACSVRRQDAGATSSTWATASCRRLLRTTCGGWSSSSTSGRSATPAADA